MDVYYRALEGYDVVAAAPGRDVALTSRLFYAVYNLGSRNTHKLRQERFRIISRRAVNRVNQMNAYIPYRKAMYMNCGLRADTLVYENKKKAGSARNREERSTRSSLALDTPVSYTHLITTRSVLRSTHGNNSSVTTTINFNYASILAHLRSLHYKLTNSCYRTLHLSLIHI